MISELDDAGRTVPAGMLEGLEAISWSQLQDLDGVATELPQLIRSLSDADEKIRRKALEELALRVWSESQRSEATPRVVPFLIELATETSVPARSQVISLITRIGIGEERLHIPSGLWPARYRDNCTAREWELRDALARERESLIVPGRDSPPLSVNGMSSWAWESYQAVDEGVPELVGLVLDEDDEVRSAAIHAVAWFPRHAKLALPELYKVIEATNGEGEMANALIAAGMLTRTVEPPMPPPKFGALLSVYRSPLVRTAAALAMARKPLDNGIQDLLCDYLMASSTVDEPDHPFAFNQRHLIAHVALTLALWAEDDIETVVRAVLCGLEKSTFFGKYDTARALLELGRPYGEARAFGLLAPRVTNRQRIILRAVADHGAWRLPFDDTQAWGNFARLLDGFGLPDSPAAMKCMLTWGLRKPNWWRALRSS